MQPCPALPFLSDSSAAALIADGDNTALLYHDCRDGKNSLISAVKEWEKTAWQWYCDAVKRAGLKVGECPAGK